MKAYSYKLKLPIIMAICFFMVQGFAGQNVRAGQAPPVTIDQLMEHLAFDKSQQKNFSPVKFYLPACRTWNKRRKNWL